MILKEIHRAIMSRVSEKKKLWKLPWSFYGWIREIRGIREIRAISEAFLGIFFKEKPGRISGEISKGFSKNISWDIFKWIYIAP